MAIARSARLLAGSMILAAAALAGCSTNNGSDATAAISGTGAAPAGAVAQGQQAAPLVPALPPIANATCEELKTELSTLGAEKIPQKLSQFGQSKYTPTPEESAKFTRYVELNQANKARCKVAAADPAATQPAKKKKKQTTEAAATTAAASAAVTTTPEKKKAKAAAKQEQPKTVAAATQTAAKKKPVATGTAATAATVDQAGTTPLIGTPPSAVNVDPNTQGVTTTIIPD